MFLLVSKISMQMRAFNDADYIYLPRVHVMVASALNPFPNDKFLTSKSKEFTDDYFEFDENSRKFSKREENAVGKGEIARYEQFLLFPQCFQKPCIADT